jgi:hypothetical protein
MQATASAGCIPVLHAEDRPGGLCPVACMRSSGTALKL